MQSFNQQVAQNVAQYLADRQVFLPGGVLQEAVAAAIPKPTTIGEMTVAEALRAAGHVAEHLGGQDVDADPFGRAVDEVEPEDAPSDYGDYVYACRLARRLHGLISGNPNDESFTLMPDLNGVLSQIEGGITRLSLRVVHPQQS